MPDSIDAVLTFNGTSQGTVSYSSTGLAAGERLRFVLQADASSLAAKIASKVQTPPKRASVVGSGTLKAPSDAPHWRVGL